SLRPGLSSDVASSSTQSFLSLVFSLKVPPSRFASSSAPLRLPPLSFCRIMYKTRFLELLKWAWIQYLAVFIVFYAITERIASYLFEDRILTSVVYRID